MSDQEYITTFEDLTCHCDMREHRFQTITRFVSSLRSKIRRAIIIGSYNLNTIEEAFDVALKMTDFQKVGQYQGLVFEV